MESKKNENADLRGKRSLFLATGLMLSLAMVLTAFEWKTFGNGEIMDLGPLTDNFDELTEIPITEMPPPEKPPVQQPTIIEIPDTEEVLEEIDYELDMNITEDDIIEDIVVDAEPEEEVAEQLFLVVEEEASFPGGDKAWAQFLKKNFKYPRNAQRMGIEGKVFLSFIVDKNGVISDIQVTRGIGGGCNEEAIRVLQNSPRWNPGRQRGVAVKSRMALQIAFQLR